MLFFKLFFIFLVTENIYQNYIPGLNYFDEIITIIASLLLLRNYKNQVPGRIYDIKILRSITLIIILGTCATVTYSIQPNFDGVWRDALAVAKFPICYCGLKFSMQRYDKRLILKGIVPFCKLYICVLITFAIYNLINYTPWLSNGNRYGLPLYSFLYTHSTFLVIAVLSMMAILLADDIKRNKIFILFGLIILILTFRSKAFTAIAFILLSLWWINHRRYISHSKAGFVIGVMIAILIAIYVSMERIEEYVTYGDTSARGAFYIYGLDIALEKFPLGSGFCTFASSLSAKYYSPLYYEYGMNYITGITVDDISYAGDVFWPNIYAQYGYIGFVTYLFMLYYIFKSISSRFQMFSNQWIGATTIFIYSISAAFAEAFYTNDSAVIAAVILTVYINPKEKIIKK